MFADDTNLKISGPPENIKYIIECLENDLNRIICWMNENNLSLNVDKTQFILIGRPHIVKSIGTVTININNAVIHSATSLKCLGLIFDDSLDWTNHITDKVRKCNGILYSLYPIQNIINETNRKIIINTKIMPIIRYMSSLWGSAPLYNTNLVEELIRKCARFVLGIRKYDCVLNLLTNTLFWLMPKYLYIYEALKIVYKICKGDCPDIFNGYLDFNNITIRSTRSKTYTNVLLPNNSSKIIERTFSYVGVQEWYQVPISIRESDNITIFKRNLLKHLLNLQCNTSDTDIVSPYNEINCCNLSCIESVVNFNQSNL